MRGTKLALVVTAIAVTAMVTSCAGTQPEALDPESATCKPFKQYQGREGEVTIYSGYTSPDDKRYRESWKTFEQCTGITIKLTGDKDAETNLKIRVTGGNAPDLAMIAQPGRIQSMVATGKAIPANDVVAENVKQNWNESWYEYGSVDGTFYAAPTVATVASSVWYSPRAFAEQGLETPTTWDEMLTLSDEIAANGEKPWCVGIEAGSATGWIATNWLEEIVLRQQGPEVYDQWVAHEIPFNDPRIAEALATAGDILKNDDYVNAGIGDVKSIATTSEDKAPLPILQATCSMSYNLSSYGTNWPEGTSTGPGEDDDTFTFYLPTISDDFGVPVEVGGDFLLAFSDRPEVQAVQEYLSSVEWAESRIAVHGGWISANNGVSADTYADPVDRQAFELLIDPDAVLRFDGSDMMPAAIGTGEFWTQMTQWILGQDDQTTLDAIEDAWPKDGSSK
ncbi:ABC transporter substrate-binding protein [Microbacterium trichothecenolyticum]|uniref:Multiple sugar-binding protein n=1 Tax=Microbacterium trichothecenolyticum TaxID=69370 RepID=A0A0M2HC45_MICTR|nr:ABC transporter substrate-binding protein [Microbacterium trichothecenolyticum]KJL41678.1 Multiple sugar-binding protein precursor [Microbacterium trichothecenolyticum]